MRSFLLFGLLSLVGCTLKEDCVGCHIDIPIPDCVIVNLEAGSLEKCPDASSSDGE